MGLRIKRSFQIDSPLTFEAKLFEWGKQFDKIVWLESNNHDDKYGSFRSVLAISSQTSQSKKVIKNFDELQNFTCKKPDWLFGYFSYDLKNELEDLESNNYDSLFFSNLTFFQPQKVIVVNGTTVAFQYLEGDADNIEKDLKEILEASSSDRHTLDISRNIKIKMRVKKDAYFEKVGGLLRHIHRGDVYEVNFCQEFFSEKTCIDPWSTYKRLNNISKAPFAAFLKLEDNYLMSASPERYLKRLSNVVVSQPIKGTAPRSQDLLEDTRIREQLKIDVKERAENIMITDLVRNDLSKSAKKGTVAVEELCEVYSFEQVHQMISTITSEVDSKKNSVDLIRDTFPMGSMTGAPKVSAMKLIETYEETKRGLYSGAVGYFTPEGDFDFNVVIRSILYNANKKYVSYSVGSAITAKSDPEREYQECLLKAKALRSVLESD